MYPTQQGFYVWTGGRWLPALAVPLDHVGRMAVLTRYLLYVDGHGRPHMAHIGLYTDGVSWFNQQYGEYMRAGCLHDSDCAIVRSLPVGPGRNEVQAHVDARFYEMCEHLGMSRIRACAWFAAVSMHALTQRRTMCPDYRYELAGYLKCRGMRPELVAHYCMMREKHAPPVL